MYLTRFFILFFKTKDPRAKNCQNAPQILNPLSINTLILIWIVNKFELLMKSILYFSRLNLDGLMTHLPVWCRGVFHSLTPIPFFVCDDFFPSPPLSH